MAKHDTVVTLQTLSMHLGLSKGVISLVLNAAPGSEAIPPATQDRIRQAASDLKYKPNYFARSLSSKRSFMIGILATSLREGYDSAILAGIELQLVDSPYLSLITSHLWSPSLIERNIGTLLERGAEGLILINTQPPVMKSQPPIVVLGGRILQSGLHQIAVDNHAGAGLAVRHLVELGHKRIAVIRGHDDSLDSEARWLGIRSYFRELGVTLPQSLVIQLSRHDKTALGGTEEGYEAAQKLLSMGQPFTGLIAFNDLTAIGAILALQAAGLNVPADVSVIGFDDIPYACLTHPSLTTIRQPLVNMGELAIKTLLALIEKTSIPSEKVLLSPELLGRESTSVARASLA